MSWWALTYRIQPQIRKKNFLKDPQHRRSSASESCLVHAVSQYYAGREAAVGKLERTCETGGRILSRREALEDCVTFDTPPFISVQATIGTPAAEGVAAVYCVLQSVTGQWAGRRKQ